MLCLVVAPDTAVAINTLNASQTGRRILPVTSIDGDKVLNADILTDPLTWGAYFPTLQGVERVQAAGQTSSGTERLKLGAVRATPAPDGVSPPAPVPLYTKRQATTRVNTRNFTYTTTAVRHQARIRHTLPAGAGQALGLVLRYAAFSFQAGGAGDLAGVAKVIEGVAVEYPPGQINRVTFGGSNSLILPSGPTFVDSDPLPLEFSDGAVLYEQLSYVQAGTAWDAPQEVWPSLGEYSYYGSAADASQIATGQPGALPLATTGQAWGAAMILADFAAPQSAVVIVGDSIATGSGGDNTMVQVENAGYIARGLGNALGWCRMTTPSATLDAATNATANHAMLANGRVTHAIVQMGTNNVMAGQSFDTVQGKFLDLWMTMFKLGLTISQCTLLPTTESTDGFVTARNQTPRATEAVRVAINDWIRTKPWPLSAVFDAADLIEADASNVMSRNGGRWKVTGGIAPTPEGVHPVPTVSAALAESIDLSLFVV